jgi:hypothetical protein
MKSKVIVLMIFLPAIAVSFVTQKSPARQSAQTKDSTAVAPAVSVRERFVGTWKLVSTEYRYTDGTRRPHVRAAHESGPAGVDGGGASDGRGEDFCLRRIFCVLREI